MARQLEHWALSERPRLHQIRVFLSSPGDVAVERKLVREIAEGLSAEPFFRDRAVVAVVSWDDPAAQTPMLAQLTPQEAVNRGRPKPSACDIVVVILWSRMGTPLPDEYRKPDGGRYLSGTEWEYEDALSAAPQPDVLVYRRTERVLLDADEADLAAKLEQRDRVKRFFARFRDADGSLRGGIAEYDSPSAFANLFGKNLRERAAARLNTVHLRDISVHLSSTAVRNSMKSQHPKKFWQCDELPR